MFSSRYVLACSLSPARLVGLVDTRVHLLLGDRQTSSRKDDATDANQGVLQDGPLSVTLSSHARARPYIPDLDWCQISCCVQAETGASSREALACVLHRAASCFPNLSVSPPEASRSSASAGPSAPFFRTFDSTKLTHSRVGRKAGGDRPRHASQLGRRRLFSSTSSHQLSALPFTLLRPPSHLSPTCRP